MECAKVTAGVRKPKKKQVKDELDRLKQAEKKKRRLEKALATSAAIRSELEKKKQKKKEEQERLDEEGAAIAEAVALRVLLDEDEGPTSWDHARQLRVPYQEFSSKYSLENIGCMRNQMGNSNLMGLSYPLGRGGYYPQYLGDGWGSVGLSAGCLAAEAVSSLKIADDARGDAYLFNHMLRG
ncbi:hypothetical protein ACJIZ3_022262 [Penstemon smallii]|uniref:Uncharacterized protein n=1 Tax=Penstemon smallii TaxID=265156 RepID=A0ABD3TM52_9LAMI